MLSSLEVLAALHEKKVVTQHDLQRIGGNALNLHMLVNLILDQYRKPTEDVETVANVLDVFGCKKESEMLRSKLSLCNVIACMKLLPVSVTMSNAVLIRNSLNCCV